MKMLKSLVIGLGFLVVTAMVALGYGLYYKANHPDFRLFSDSSEKSSSQDAATPVGGGPPPLPSASSHASARGTPMAFPDLTLSLPEGCRIVEMTPDGDRLYLRAGPGTPCARVYVVDVARGVVLGTIRMTP